MAKHKVEIQDHLGNVYYPHTTTDVVFDQAGQRLSSLLDNKLNKAIQTISVPTSSFVRGGSYNKAIKQGNVVIVHLRCSFEKSRHAQHFATLPVGFRPPEYIFTAGYVHYMTSLNATFANSAMSGVWVEPDGRITLDIDRSHQFHTQEYTALEFLATLVFNVN